MTQVYFNARWNRKSEHFHNIESAVFHAVTPDPYASEGQNLSLQTALVGRLLDRLHANNLLSNADLEVVLGQDYEVIE